MTFAGMTELEGLVEEVATDDAISVLVLASDVPGYFVAHGDLEDLVRMGKGTPFEGDAMSWPRTLDRFSTIPQVVVAAMNGQAWGGGLEMALACTLRVAGPDAHFALCEVGLGLIPGGGGTQRLPRLIGAGRASELILSGRAVGPDEAFRLGLVEAVLTGASFMEAVLEWVRPMSLRPSGSLRAAKQAIVQGLGLPLEQGLALEGTLVGPLLTAPETMVREQQVIERYRTTPVDQVVTI
jgi:enoyl-CoA hydratase/carnithine racemase